MCYQNNNCKNTDVAAIIILPAITTIMCVVAAFLSTNWLSFRFFIILFVLSIKLSVKIGKCIWEYLESDNCND